MKYIGRLLVTIIFFNSCSDFQNKENVQEIDNVSIILESEYFYYEPFFKNDALKSMYNIKENDLVYYVKNQTEKEVCLFLNHVAFRYGDVVEYLITKKSNNNSKSLIKNYIEPNTLLKYSEVRFKNLSNIDLNCPLIDIEKIDIEKSLFLKPYEEARIHVKTSLPIYYHRSNDDHRIPSKFDVKSYFLIIDYNEYKIAKRDKIKLSNYQRYYLTKTLHYEFENKNR